MAENKGTSKSVIIISSILGVSLLGLVIYYIFKPVSATAATGTLTPQQLAAIKQLQAAAATNNTSSNAATNGIASLATSLLSNLFKSGSGSSSATNNLSSDQINQLDAYYQSNYGMSYNQVNASVDLFNSEKSQGLIDNSGNYITQSVTSNDLGSVYNPNSTIGGTLSGGPALSQSDISGYGSSNSSNDYSMYSNLDQIMSTNG